jgi:hypothetical protein
MQNIEWTVVNRATGRRATVGGFSRRGANLAVLEWRERQRLGGRPDISADQVQALAPVPLTQVTSRLPDTEYRWEQT